MAKNPLIAGLVSLIPQFIGTLSTLIKNKKERKEVAKAIPATTGEAIVDSVKDMVSGNLSSKRALNIGGTAILIYHGINTNNVWVMALGVAYSLGMSLITYLSDRSHRD